VDFKSFKPPDWLLIGGGAVVFLFGFFDWFDTGGTSSSAFKFTVTGVFPWLLIVGSALLAYQIRAGLLQVRKWPWPTIFLCATAIGAILILVRVIIGADWDDFGAGGAEVESAEAAGVDTSFGRKFTLWLSFAGAIAATVGAGLGFVAAGGTVNDLPFVSRLRGAASAASQRSAARKAAKAETTATQSEFEAEPDRRLPPGEQDRPFDVGDDTDWGDPNRP
jgi:hypothetical protein